MGNESKTPEHIWAWWDNDYDVGMINTHGDKRYTPTEAREYVPADRIEELEAKLAEALEMALDECGYLWRSESYNNWWQDRRNRVVELKGDK